MGRTQGTFADRVRERAATVPDEIAVSWPGGALRHADLHYLSANVASCLVEHGVRTGDVVALSASLSGASVAALLACWTIGATPWPFDPDGPAGRLASMFDAAEPSAVIVPPATVVRHHEHAPRIVLDHSKPHPAPDLGAHRAAVPSGHAYLLFTSGSTGEPKGVLMAMAGLELLADWQAADQGPGAIGQFAPLTFDVAFQEIATALHTGAEIIVFSAEERSDPELLARRITTSRIATLFLPTAALHSFCEALRTVRLDSLRRVVVAGEQLRIAEPVRAFFGLNDHCRLHNHYGPTETHVVTAHVLSGPPLEWPDLPPIGRPLPSVELEVLREGRPVDPGEVGELVVRGPRLALGYVASGAVAEEGGFARDARGLRYATGDLVRWDGSELRYIARADSQVKIRGHRVEVGEVEAVIERHADVRRCVVTAFDHGSHSELVAYIVTDDPVEDPAGVVRITHRSLESWCRRHLPEPMVPSTWLRVDALPISAHGKIDRRGLPPPPRSRPETAQRYVAPTTETERTVAAIWSRVLGLDEIGVLDEFAYLGGTSLQATRILSALRAELVPDVRAVDVYSHPTVRSFSEFYDGRECTEARAASRAQSSGRVAIVGMACRFPGATDLEQFWANLVAGTESIHRGPPNEERPGFIAAAGRIADIDRFDAEYFGMSDGDAARTDPQQRILLELAVAALEDAGIPSSRRHSTGVFAGCGPSTYLLNNLLPGRPARPNRNFIDSVDELDLLIGNDKDYIATRIAYALDLHGPALTVTAACATGLVAVDIARSALLTGACDCALAGAVSVASPEVHGYEYEPGLMYSADGVCRAFSAEASGTVFSSGGGMVVLRRLEDAIEAGDPIYAVIEGSAVGNDGGSSPRSLPSGQMHGPPQARKAGLAGLRERFQAANPPTLRQANVLSSGSATADGDLTAARRGLSTLVPGGGQGGRNGHHVARARLHGDPPLGLWHLGTHTAPTG